MSRLGGIGHRLHSGETSYDFIGRRRLWYAISGLVVLVSALALAIGGLNLSIEFKGGAQFKVAHAASQAGAVAEARTVAEQEGVAEPVVVTVGQDVQVQTPPLPNAKVNALQDALAARFHVPVDNVSTSQVGAVWGSQITSKAIQGLVVFIIAVIIFISIVFEWRMAASAIIALIHDVLLTAGIYALTRFEVSPATVIALLTILGYSLYDTVVVYDKVKENTRGIAGGNRLTYSQAANLAVNQTLARSINTSVIALLPIAGLLFVGAGILGAGTLKDLSLALFVGIAAGTYSSIFIATPLVCEFKEREPKYRALRTRVESRSRRAATRGPAAGAVADEESGRATSSRAVTALLERDGDEGTPEQLAADDLPAAEEARTSTLGPRPPMRPARPTQRRKNAGRPSGKRRR